MDDKPVMRRRTIAAALTPLLLIAGVGLTAGPAVAKPAVTEYPRLSAFPVPGTRTASPTTTITVRGVKPANIGAVTVKGTASAVHTFTVHPDSDGFGASLAMDRPFTPGETVKVTTGLAIPGAVKGVYYFKVAVPATDLPTMPAPRVDAANAQTFVSAPGLTPPKVTVTTNTTKDSEGDLFLAPHAGSLQQGPMIVDPEGNLIWSHPLTTLTSTDFRVQNYQGRPVLTWWEGASSGGHGYGVGQIYGSDYQPVATVSAGNGYSTDAHEFSLTAAGTALVTIYSAVQWDLRPVGGPQNGTVLDGIVQEIDIASGQVLFEWHSLDHVALTDSYSKYVAGVPYDYFHVNSADKSANGNYLISSRVTSALYDLDRTTGKVLWRLGGKHSSFALGKGVTLSFQHDARWHSDGSLTVFDNAVGAPSADWRSHGLRIRLDPVKHTATLVADYTYPKGLLAPTQGDVQLLPDGNVMIGYGERSQLAEYSSTGALVLAATFPAGTSSYRSYRFPWVGTPITPPSAVATTAAGTTTVHVSWNGATQVASWQLFAGPSAAALTPVGTVARTGFETTLTVPGAPAYVMARALDAVGNLLGDSAALRPVNQ